jgi:hypothetical protein
MQRRVSGNLCDIKLQPILTPLNRSVLAVEPVLLYGGLLF